MVPWSARELFLISQGLTQLTEYPHESTEVINLHGNCFQVIPELSRLIYLKELDLSSNKIANMRGLANLRTLRVLNLSCNFIRKVEGMASLTSLVKLDLSHNQIEDLCGFREMYGEGYSLTAVSLHDNMIASLSHLVSSMRGCLNLRCLILNQDGLTNPVCSEADYRERLISRLSQLLVLDNISRSGQALRMSDIPGLSMQTFDQFLNFPIDLIGNSYDIAEICENVNKAFNQTDKDMCLNSKQNATSQSELITPKIDLAMEKYKESYYTDYTSDSKSDYRQEIETTSMLNYERDLSSGILPEMSSMSLDSSKSVNVNTSQNSQTTEFHNSSKESTLKKSHEITMTQMDIENKDKRIEKGVYSSKQKKCKTSAIKCKNLTEKQPKHKIHTVPQPEGITSSKKVTKKTSLQQTKKDTQTCQTDKEYRDVIETTYKNLVEELDDECSRRSKAELALKEMTNFVNQIKERAHQTELHYENAFQENTYFKESLKKEKDYNIKLEQELDSTKQKKTNIQEELKAAKANVESQKLLFNEMQTSASGRENQHLKVLIEERKRFQKVQQIAATTTKQSQDMKCTLTSLQKQVTELQQLLASRELEHKEELRDRFKLGSKELCKVIDKELKNFQLQHEERSKLQAERTEMMEKHYKEVEKELNHALLLESGHVNHLQLAYNAIAKENEMNKQALVAAQTKDKKATETLSQLTNVVKKQKDQIANLLKSEQEAISKHRQQMQDMNSQLTESRKKVTQLDKLKQDCLRFQAQIEAQESLIVGLRAERKVWENELAQQGTSLAQDRGRLEVKIESLVTEVDYLKKQLKTEVDTVKIKTKVIDDQTDTIKSLKTELLQKDKLMLEVQEDASRSQKKIEDELTFEREAMQESQFTIQRLQERKEELKDQLALMEKELEESQSAHNVLKQHWKQKSDLIGSLEVQVKQAKVSWEKKENILVADCEKAWAVVKKNEEKMKKMDSSFRKQLDEKEKAQQKIIAQLSKDRQLELDIANHKILDLEDEMREILKESSNVQEKMAKLAKFFGNIAPEIQK